MINISRSGRGEWKGEVEGRVDGGGEAVNFHG